MTEQEVTASIGEDAGGRWHVTTESGSRYLVDLDEALLTRVPEADVERELRRDGEQLPLYGIEVCEVGTGALFYIQVRPDAITARITTCVVAIDRAEPCAHVGQQDA